MAAKSQDQFKFMKAVENNLEFAEKVDVKPSIAKEITKGNKGKKAFSKLRERLTTKKETY